MVDQKLSALPLITPTGAERVYLDNGTDKAATVDAIGAFALGGLLLASKVQDGSGTIVYYVSPTGNDANDGSAIDDARAFRTLAFAATTASRVYNDIGPAMGGITIRMKPGVYTETAQVLFSGYSGWNSPDVQIESASGSIGDVTVNFTNYEDGALLWAQSMYVNPYGIIFNVAVANPEWVVGAVQGGWLDCYNCTFNGGAYTNNTPMINVYDSQSKAFFSNCTFSGNAYSLVYAPNGGRVQMTNTTFVGTPSYVNPAFDIGGGTVCDLYSPYFTGSFIGSSYRVQTNAVLRTNGGNSTTIPGTLAGSVSTGGQYV